MLPQKKYNKSIVRAGWEGFAFPKHKNIKVSGDPVEIPEKTIQAIVDTLLLCDHIPYIRLTTQLFMAVIKSPVLSGRLKAWILDGISGWPDNAAMLPLCEYNGIKFCLSCLIENKTVTGKLHGKQKIRNKELGFNIVRSEADARNVIKTFRQFHTKISNYLKSESIPSAS